MAHHDCSDLTPVRVYEVWPHIRDNAKPRSEDDAWKLLEARTYCPPSKAHIKRLQKFRETFTRRGPQAAPDTSARKHINELAKMGREALAVADCARIIERHVIQSSRPIVPDTHKPASPTANRAYHAAPTSDWPTPDQLNEQAQRLEREHQQALRTVGR